MCTVAFRSDPDAGLLQLLSVRDEFLDRPTRPFGHWWPDTAPEALGAQDLVAGGTNLALDITRHQAWIVVNGPAEISDGPVRSRGWLPLNALAGRLPDPESLTNTPGFHLLRAEARRVSIWTWDGNELTTRPVAAGNHVLTYAGLDASNHQRSRATSTVLDSAPLDAEPDSWNEVLAAAWVNPYDLGSRPYGSVGATAIRLGPVEAHGWSRRHDDGSWIPMTEETN